MYHFLFESRGYVYGLQIERRGRSRVVVSVFSGDVEHGQGEEDWSQHRGLQRLACYEGHLRDDLVGGDCIEPDNAERIVRYCFDSFFPVKESVVAV